MKPHRAWLRLLQGCLIASAAWTTVDAQAPFFAQAGGAGHMQVFESDGAWTTPQGRTDHVFVLLCGAGGGGAGLASLLTTGAGGGGGGGGAVLTTVPVRPGASYTVTVGHGGQAGADGVEGLAGTATIFQSAAGQILAQADAGQGGGFNADHSTPVAGANGEGTAHPSGGLVRRGVRQASDAPRLPGVLDALCATFAPTDRGSGGGGGFYIASENRFVPAAAGQDGWVLLIW